jgi:NAD(P)H-hydrate epimerase
MTIKEAAKNDNTSYIVNYLLKKYPAKKWVIDGGALQEVDSGLITKSCILTPHHKEFEGLIARAIKRPGLLSEGQALSKDCADLSQTLKNCTILLKGQTDIVCQGDRYVKISGGNAGMTKGGTGDVLAGLVAALYTKNDSWTAATVASWVNKQAGDELYKRVGPYFNAADLAREIPLTIYGIMREDVPT